MKSCKPFAFLLALLMVASTICPQMATAGAKRRIAVMPFEYGAVSSEVGTYDVGKGIVSLIITDLVNDGTYSVIERQMLDSLLKEQNLSVSDRADPATACKIGKLLSVDAIVVGTVTQFGFENKSMNVGGVGSVASGYVPYVGGLGGMLGGIGSKKSKCKVAIDARIVDTHTAEILGAVHGAGESKRSGVSLFGGAGGADWGSSGFATSIAGEAVLAAVSQICTQVKDMATKIPDNQSLAAANVQGKIADVTGTTVIVNVGKNNGLAVGDALQAERPYKTVKDPATGKVLKELTNTVGVIKLTQVDAESSTGDLVKGAGVRVGDTVRKVTTSVEAIVLTPLPSSTAAKPATPVTKTK